MAKKQKSFFDYRSAVAPATGAEVPLNIMGEFVTVHSVVGSVLIRVNETDTFIPAIAKMTLRLDGKEEFKTIYLKAVGGGTLNFYFGVGIIFFGGDSSGGGGGGSGQIVIGALADPNVGAITPDDPTQAAIYYKDDVAVSFWSWSVANQNWIPIVT